ncbi:MAG: molybdopterin-dependent oxidoreductase [Bacteroidetes bacterium]|nr:molybdopterin-dependent oxidoreductase [Bacteroidota bacterium]
MTETASARPKKGMKRRTFLVTGALSAAALSVMKVPRLHAFKKVDSQRLAGYVQGAWVPTTCQGCTTWCAVEVFVQDGRASHVRGNQHSQANYGHVCPKGHLLIQQLYDPDRVKVPMKRTNTRKGKGVDPQFVPITWDEATDTIATKLMELRAADETHKFLFLRGRYSNGLNSVIYDSFPKLFGSPNNVSHSAVCAEAEKFGPYYTEGQWSYRQYDLTATECLVLWGTDPLSANRHVPFAIKAIPELLERGGKMITIDPRLSSTALKSHRWAPVTPGQDGALASAIAHVILTEGRWSKQFVGDFNDGVNRFVTDQLVSEDTFTENHSSGLVKWWNIELKDKTPAWASVLTGLTAAEIISIARMMADAAPRTCIWLGPGACMSPRGSYTSMAIHALNGLLGSADSEGGIFYKPKVSKGSLPSISAYQDETATTGLKQKKIDQRGTLLFPALKEGKSGGGVVSNRTAQAILDEDPYDIKVIIANWVNYNYSGYQTELWDRAMEKVPFLVHITTNASEMSQFADIVLPAAHHATERYSGSDNAGNRISFVSIQQPVVEPLWDVRSCEGEVPWLIAEKLRDKGFSNIYDYFSSEIKDPDTGATPTNSAEFALYTAKIFLQDAYTRAGGWDTFKQVGMTSYGPAEFGKTWSNLKTATGKFEFYSETLKAALQSHADKHATTINDVLSQCSLLAMDDMAFVPHYEPPLRIGSKAGFPMDFVDYKSRLNREGRAGNCSWYYEFKKVDPGDVRWDDVIKINPQDAASLNLNNGDVVTVNSPTGSVKATIRIWPGIAPGVATKSFGQGHWAVGKIATIDYHGAKARGANNNDLMPAEYDRLSGSSARNGGFFGVRIDPVTSVAAAPKAADFDLLPVYPNPTAMPRASVTVYLSKPAPVRLELFNNLGAKVREVVDTQLNNGTHTIPLDLSQLPAGLYLLRMRSGEFVKSQKLIIQR